MTVFPSTSALALAQDAVERLVLHNELFQLPDHTPSALLTQRACYITLFENPGHRIRTQYGTPLPYERNLALEIISNAIHAVRMSPTPIRKADLRSIIYSLTILGPLERITSDKHLNPAQYGLYITSDNGKSAIVLPRRAGIETPQEQMGVAWREADVNQGEIVSMYRFSTSHFE